MLLPRIFDQNSESKTTTQSLLRVDSVGVHFVANLKKKRPYTTVTKAGFPLSTVIN